MYRILSLLLAIVLYATLSTFHIDSWPPVTEDEPWIAAAPVKLASKGLYGSDLFTGYYGSENGLYHLNPLYPLLLAGVFKVAGIGVTQMRLLPLIFGLLLILLVYYTARELFDDRVAMLSIALLLFLRLTATVTGSGIPLLDLARIGRPDIAVPLFGLLSLLLFIRGETSARWPFYFSSGLAVGLAALCHLYGAFWLPGLLMVMVARRRKGALRQREFYALIAGFILVWIPVALWLASGWDQFLGQSSLVADRFDILAPRFYLHNVLHEFERYRALGLVHRGGRVELLRPGAWLAVIATPVALLLLLRRLRRPTIDNGSMIAIILIVQTGLFAFVLSIKFFNYFIALWPLVVMILAWGGERLWRSSRKGQLLVGSLLAMVLLEGSVAMVADQRRGAAATDYREYESRLAAVIPHGSRILGLPEYWIGLRGYDYRSWLLPILLSEPGNSAPGRPLDSALATVAPDVILIDRHMNQFLTEIADSSSPRHPQFAQYRKFMESHNARLIGTVADSTYGTTQIYSIQK